MAKRVRQEIEYLGVLLVKALVAMVPLSMVREFGALLGWTAYRIAGIRREVTLANIEQALGGEADRKALDRAGKRSYMNLGRAMVEFASFERLSGERVLRMVSFEGLSHLDRALERGKGAVLITGHFGNWELLGAALARKGYPIHFLVGRQSNRKVDDLMNRLRRAQGIGIISREAALKKVLRALKNNQLVAMLPDQDAGRGGVFVEFLGKPASTYRGPATFSLREGCPIIVGFILRTARGRMRAIIEEPILPDSGKEESAALVELTQAYSDLIARYARRYPDHYFWPHRRWKTKKITP